ATPVAEFDAATREQMFRGDGGDFAGLITLLNQELATATDPARQEELEAFRGHVVCPACGGARLRPEALSVRIAGKHIAEVCDLSIGDSLRFMDTVAAGTWPLSPDSWNIAQPILREIVPRLRFLEKVGLDYVTLNRASDTLSGGELQRVRLA